MFKENATSKLIILFVAETMEAPIQSDILTEICDKNNWVAYMECTHFIQELIETNMLINISKNSTPLYVPSKDGRECLSIFYQQIPLSIRDAIKEHIKVYRQSYRKKQEYWSDYYPNNDGSYTVVMRINLSTQQNPLLELKINVQTRRAAESLYKSWVDKAPSVYEMIYDNLL